MDIGSIDPFDLPWDVGAVIGEVREAEKLCPGVYYAAVYGIFDGSTEFYLVEKNAGSISDTAKSYGQRMDGLPDCLLYSFEGGVRK